MEMEDQYTGRIRINIKLRGPRGPTGPRGGSGTRKASIRESTKEYFITI